MRKIFRTVVQFISQVINPPVEKPAKPSKPPWKRPLRTLLQWPIRKPTLRNRITSIFFALFIAFILISGSSLLLVLNYQMRHYNEFVGYQYATQLSRMLEAYYRAQKSWRGINEWLYENFASDQLAYTPNSRQNSSLSQNGFRTPFYLSISPPKTGEINPDIAQFSFCSKCLLMPQDEPNNQANFLDSVFDLWFYEFHGLKMVLPQTFSIGPVLASNSSQILLHQSLHQSLHNDKPFTSRESRKFFNQEGFSNWIDAKDRPELFASEWFAPKTKLPLFLGQRFQPNGYSQIFVLLDPDSQEVIASNQDLDSLKKTLGATWEPLKKYIRDYQANKKPKPVRKNKQTGYWQPEKPRVYSSLYLTPDPPPGEKRNIFPINDNSGQTVAFLYAKSIVSPIWKDLNTEINHTIVKIALFSCLFMILLYWLVDRFHLRRLFMPLQSLSDIAKQVRKGNTQARVRQIPKEIELALVTEQFNKMLDSLNYQTMLRDQQSRDVAHELRTPITIISGELQLIQEGVYQPDEEVIQGLVNQVQQMQGIVQDLEILYKAAQTSPHAIGSNALSSQENDKNAELETTYFESICPVHLINEVFCAFHRQMEQRDITFSLHPGAKQAPGQCVSLEDSGATASQLPIPSPQQCVIFGDSRRLHQVFANCLVNAMRYTPPGGTIELACSYLDRNSSGNDNAEHLLDPEKKYLVFSVSDSGCGIPPEKRKLIFERFFRIESNRNSQSGGSGLGLAISKSFIELHGGKIWATASHLGSGAKFCFALPCCPIQPAQGPAESCCPT